MGVDELERLQLAAWSCDPYVYLPARGKLEAAGVPLKPNPYAHSWETDGGTTGPALSLNQATLDAIRQVVREELATWRDRPLVVVDAGRPTIAPGYREVVRCANGHTGVTIMAPDGTCFVCGAQASLVTEKAT